MSFDGYEEPQVVTASNEVKDQLQNIVNRCKSDQCLVDRVKNILKCLEGTPLEDIAKLVGVSKVTVSKWKSRFLSEGFELVSKFRTGWKADFQGEDKNSFIQIKLSIARSKRAFRSLAAGQTGERCLFPRLRREFAIFQRLKPLRANERPGRRAPSIKWSYRLDPASGLPIDTLYCLLIIGLPVLLRRQIADHRTWSLLVVKLDVASNKVVLFLETRSFQL